MAKQVLTKLRIDEVSAVDVGAGEGVAIKLRKQALRDAQVEAYMKRDFTDEQRKQMAAVGHAMPDGGYPIGDRKDLKNAIQAIGRAKDPNKTKKHIVRRARELGSTRDLPDKWIRKSIDRSLGYIAAMVKSEGGEDFSTELAEMQSLEFGEGLQEAIHDACHAMKHSIESIMEDGGTPDKGGAIRASYGQFLDHVQTLAPEGDVAKQQAKSLATLAKRAKEVLMANTFKKAYQSVGQNDTQDRKAEIKDKTRQMVEVEDDEKDPHADSPPSGRNATEKAMKKAKKWQKRYEILRDMSKADPDAKKFVDDPDCDMDDDVKKQFIEMSKAERRAYMDANPIDERMMQKRLEGLPSEVRKQLEMGREAAEKLEKREADEALKSFTKRATDARLPKDLGPHLVALHKVAPDALAEVLSKVETMSKSVQALEQTGYIFKEFGSRGGNGAAEGGMSGFEELMVKANEMANEGKIVINGKPASKEQCFAKLFDSRDESIREIVKRGRQDGSIR
jgi:hypothetical protein